MEQAAKKCYNCGRVMNPSGTEPKETSQTKEHIPAKNLYVGYPEKYKVNRITVPGCWRCNHEYSSIDDELRDVIGVINDKDGRLDVLTQKALKNMQRNGDLLDRLENIENLTFRFKYAPLIKYNEKNFKGVFYNAFGYPFPAEKYGIRTIIVNEGDEIDKDLMKNFGNELYFHATYDGGWQHSGHPDIFQYIIKGVKDDGRGNYKFCEDVEGSIFVICICKYHEQFEMITLAFDRDKFNVPEDM